ncbi:DUF3558 domain-containing protein [Rhodococcus fascians]|nr:DUF3558 domain-containing protein [Rhodococcus fascians]MBY3996224.1 DUF3558 domain-containing protein [Rhodococcus fascians]MBY4003061.1 DUF3558 domain-containing protein [Rhodococcus fascians]MBY4007811.1 DUF3558 domain-containing protein [Rhodococcus fascians]MBY4017436.1 DUF3558 domain-containing protein [Rhodococcus fascians]
MLAAACASALVLTGCAGSTQGSPVASGDSSTEQTTVATVPREPFDPCTIPKSAVTASGLDVSSERPDFAGISKYPGWKNCTWDGPAAKPWYYLAIMSSINSIDEYLSNPDNDRQVPVRVGPRDAIQYHAPYQNDLPDGCDIALDVGGNLIIFKLDTIGSEETLGDTCEEANALATNLEPYFPN